MPPMNIELSKEVMISQINQNQMQTQPYQPVRSRGVKESSGMLLASFPGYQFQAVYFR
jgi:hypothetical protein